MTFKLTGEGEAEAVVSKNIAIFGYKQWLLSIDNVFHNIPGSQLLSDIQTFLAGNQLYELKSHRRGWCGGGGGPKKPLEFSAINSEFSA